MSTTTERIVRVRAGSREMEAWRPLRLRLWPYLTAEENAAETEALLSRGEAYAAWVLLEGDGAAVGFAEAATREWAEGCASSPVGYLEGWYVAPERRGRGFGRLLVETAEQWARERGMREMASDTELDNQASREAHARLGYSEVARVVAFRKKL